jgi:hypothetical protein
MKVLLFSFLAAGALLGFVSCAKDEPTRSTTTTTEEHIVHPVTSTTETQTTSAY